MIFEKCKLATCGLSKIGLHNTRIWIVSLPLWFLLFIHPPCLSFPLLSWTTNLGSLLRSSNSHISFPPLASYSKMARFSRNKSRPARSTATPWFGLLNIGAALLMMITFMGMFTSVRADDVDTKADSGVTGPGKRSFCAWYAHELC